MAIGFLYGVGGKSQPDLQSKTVSPSTSQQVVQPDSGKDGLSQVTVTAVTASIDNNIVAENIKNGVSILGVTGSLTTLDTSDATATAADIADGKTAYVNGSKITGSHTDLDTSDATATADKILSGYTAYVDGTKITGTYAGSGAGSGLNIHYDTTTPPQDTSKLWIKLANEPNSIECSPRSRFDYGTMTESIGVATSKYFTEYYYIDDNYIYSYYNTYLYKYDRYTFEQISQQNRGTLYQFCVLGDNIYYLSTSSSGSSPNYSYSADLYVKNLTTGDATLLASSVGHRSGKLFYYNNSIYVVGGYTYSSGSTYGSTYYSYYKSSSIYVYDLTTNVGRTFSSPTLSGDLSVCLIGDNLYVFGGYIPSYRGYESGGGTITVSAEYNHNIYAIDLTNETYSLIGTWSADTYNMGAAYLGTNIYLVGGNANPTSIFIFDTINNTLTDSGITLTGSRSSAACYFNGTTLVLNAVGGRIDEVNVTVTLQSGLLKVLTTNNKNLFNIVNWQNTTVELGVDTICIGNSNNVAEVVHWALYDETNWVDDTGTVTFTKLYPPTIAMSSNDSSQVAITNDSRNGNNVTGYKIYNGDTYITTVTTTPFDLNNVIATAGNYNLCVRATGTGYDDSNSSNIITFTAYSITNVLSNVSASSSNWHFYFSTISSLISLTYTADTGYSLPSSITVSGATLSAWNSLLGVANITNPTGNITITITGEQAQAGSYSVYIDASGGYLSCDVFDGDWMNDAENAEYVNEFGYSDEEDISTDGTVNINSGYISILCGPDANRITAFSYSGSLVPVYLDDTDTYNNIFVLQVTGNTGSIVLSPECMIKGTLITLADRSVKPIEDITYDDELLVWNFYEGKFDKAKPKWIRKAANAISYNLVKFSNGAEIGFVGMGGNSGYHRIFNKQAGTFTHTGTNDTPNGTITYSHNDEQPIVISQEVIKSPVEYYNIITEKHYNLFANSILTSCKLSNKYYIQDMKYVGKEIISADEENKYFDNLKEKKL